MKLEELHRMLARASRSVQKLNEEIARECPKTYYDSPIHPHIPLLKPKKRIRQTTKPLLNKLETEWLEVLEKRYGPGTIKAQAKKFKLANGCWLCPDFTVVAELLGGLKKEIAFEVKGKHAWEDSLVKLKVAANQWPEIEWILAWKDAGQWREQRVLP